MTRYALIDGDEVAHVACRANSVVIDWGDGEVPEADTGVAIRAARDMIESCVKATKSDKVIVCLSPRDRANFRKQVLPTYKGTRGADKPAAFWDVISMMEDDYKTRIFPWLEADDVMGILGTEPGVDTVVISQDKDMATLPVLWFNPRKQLLRKVTEADANRAWMMQTLTGDAVDEYKGCPKVGPVGADKAVAIGASLAKQWRAVVAEFVRAGLTERHALQQARCARILRREDYNRDTGEITLWDPRKPLIVDPRKWGSQPAVTAAT